MSRAKELSDDYWNSRYIDGTTGWDMGEVSPPIKSYIDQLEDKSIQLLIPGAGNSHEAEYLLSRGFLNVHLLDYAETPMKGFLDRNSDFPADQIHIEDFFKHEGEYDLILEQTLFCAIDPVLRQNYVNQVAKLLKLGGKLVGLMFSCEFDDGPPFGGSLEEYLSYFRSHFSSIEMNPCYNSIAARQGSELFINLTK